MSISSGNTELEDSRFLTGHFVIAVERLPSKMHPMLSGSVLLDVAHDGSMDVVEVLMRGFARSRSILQQNLLRSCLPGTTPYSVDPLFWLCSGQLDLFRKNRIFDFTIANLPVPIWLYFLISRLQLVKRVEIDDRCNTNAFPLPPLKSI